MADRAVARFGDNSPAFQSFVAENDNIRLRDRRATSPVAATNEPDPVTSARSKRLSTPEPSEGSRDSPISAVEVPASSLEVISSDDRTEPVTIGDGTFDRSQSIAFPSSQIYHPPPSAYDYGSIETDARLFGEAPWFNKDSLRDEALVRRYAVDGWLPGNIPINVMFTTCWRNQFACCRRDLRVPCGCTASDVRTSFAELAMHGYNRILTFTSCDVAETGMFLFRTNGEMEYFRRLCTLPPIILEVWRNHDGISMTAVCFPRPQLVKEFRFTRKQGSYWSAFVCDERRNRSKYGVAIPYQCINTFHLKGEYFQRAFARLTPAWQRIEVPLGCNVELPPVFTYKGHELKHYDSGWWVVAYSEMATKTASFILYDA